MSLVRTYMNVTVRTLAQVLGGAMGLLALSGAPAWAASELLVGVSPVSQNLPVYLAEEQGHFRSSGVAARTVDCGIGKRCLDELLAGRLHLALVGEYPLALAIGRKSPVVVLATVADAVNTNVVITRKGSGIREFRDLADRRVAVVPGTSAHYYLDSQLLLAGTDPKKVAMVDLPPASQLQALESGKVDAISVWQPWAYQFVNQLGVASAVLSSPQSFSTTFCLVSTQAVLSERRADIERAVQALSAAVDGIAGQPKEAQALLSRRLNVSPDYVQATWRDINYTLALNQPLLTSLEGHMRWAVRENQLPPGAGVNVLDHIDPGPLKKVRAKAVTIVR